jgi:hypothetical protein
MRPEIKESWLASIRGYRDGWIARPLSTPDEGRSVVGILCDMAADAGVVYRTIVTCYAYDEHMLFPPQRVLVWSGLDKNDASEIILMQHQGLSIEQIIRKIESL